MFQESKDGHTHWTCTAKLNLEGGYAECCGCNPHGCENKTNLVSDCCNAKLKPMMTDMFSYSECSACNKECNVSVLKTATTSIRNPTEIEIMIDEMTRDFTKIMPRSKSEVRRRLGELIQEVKQDKKEERKIGLLRQWLNERTDKRPITNEEIKFWLE